MNLVSELVVLDEEGNTVNDAYVSLMAYDSILFKGKTDIEGQFESSITVGDLSSICLLYTSDAAYDM